MTVNRLVSRDGGGVYRPAEVVDLVVWNPVVTAAPLAEQVGVAWEKLS